MPSEGIEGEAVGPPGGVTTTPRSRTTNVSLVKSARGDFTIFF
jgi:hypothetical protein